MNIAIPYWLLVICSIYFIYLAPGIMAIHYLDQKLEEIDNGVAKWSHLYNLIKLDRTGTARIYYSVSEKNYIKEIAPPLQEGFFYWAPRLLLAIPFSVAVIILHLGTLGEFPIIPRQFSFFHILFWPRTFYLILRQLKSNYADYEKCKAYVKRNIENRDQLA